MALFETISNIYSNFLKLMRHNDTLLTAASKAARFDLDYQILGSEDFDYVKQLQRSLQLSHRYLTTLANSDHFYDVFRSAFGSSFQEDAASQLRAQWQRGQYDTLPKVEVLGNELGSASGAYAASTNTIYLSQRFLATGTVDAIASVLLEEIGHFVDARVNQLDAKGDEGAIFSTLVQKGSINSTELSHHLADDDTTTITFGGKNVVIEKADEVPTPPPSPSVWGSITWQDKDKKRHVVRGAQIRLVEVNGSGPPSVLHVGETLDSGYYLLELENYPIDEGSEFFLEVVADGDNQTVVNQSGNPYSVRFSLGSLWEGRIRKNLNINPYEDGISLNQETNRQAFSIYEAMYTANAFTEEVRKNSLGKISVEYPIDENTHYSSGTGDLVLSRKISVNKFQYEDWDVLLHEYGHYLAEIDNLAHESFFLGRLPTADMHVFGESNIAGAASLLLNPEGGKLDGMRLAWSEGLANYLGFAMQAVGRERDVNALPRHMTVLQGFDYDLHNVSNGTFVEGAFNIGSGRIPNSDGELKKPEGEGDEVAVAAILYDIADSISADNRLADPIQLEITDSEGNSLKGHRALYEFLNNQTQIESLDDLWDELTIQVYTTNKHKAALGAIFENHGVSPQLNLALDYSYNYDSVNDIPTFYWQRGNEIIEDGVLTESNDLFRVLVFNETFSDLVLQSGENELDMQTSWTPSDAVWQAAVDAGKIKDGETYKYVVTGRDQRRGLEGDLWGLDWRSTSKARTGDYWSAAREFTINTSRVNVTTLETGLTAFNTLQQSLDNAEALDGVPIVGSLSEPQGVLGFIDKLQDNLRLQIKDVPRDSEGDATSSKVREAFIRAIANSGLLGDVVEENVDGGVQFNFSLNGSAGGASHSIAADLGLAGLGLKLKSGSRAAVDIDYTFNFSIGVDSDNKFYFDTPDESDLSFDISANLNNLDATGTLGFLNVDIEDDGSTVGLQLDVDLDKSAVKNVDLGGKADLNFDLETSFAGSKTLPKLLTDFELDWDWDQAGSDPTVAFNNVRLDVGSFVSNFASPILSNVHSVTKRLQPVVDLLGYQVNLGPKRVAVADLFGSSNAALVRSLDKVVTLVNTVPTGTPSENAQIKLGSFRLGGGVDVSKEGSKLSDGTITSVTDALDLTTQINGFLDSDYRNFFSELDHTSSTGFAFPLLDDPDQAFNLLLGKDADLFTYDMPELSIGATASTFIPIFGPLGARLEGSATAEADINFGFDTHGLRKVAAGSSEKHVFDGLYLTPDSGLNLQANVLAAAELNAGIARAGAGGGLTGNVDLSLRDYDRDNKVHLDEFSLDNPFTSSGKLVAGLHAYFKIGWGIFSYTKRYTGPQTTLLDFNSSGKGSGSRIGIIENPHQKSSVVTLRGTSATGNEIAKQRTGTTSNDRIYGGRETDFIIGGPGADYISGGSGFDVASYATAATGVRVDLTARTGTGDAAGDSYRSIEQIEGSSSADTLIGDIGNNVFDGLSGNDKLEGRDGNDVLIGGSGRDTLNGGRGSDFVSYSTSAYGVRIDLQRGTASGGDASGDRLISIENIEGSESADTLKGNSSNNMLVGLGGDDTIEGNAGLDTLTGGGGRDRFIIRGGGTDTITDFDLLRDRLWVEATYFDELSFSQSGSDALIRLGGQTIARLKGVRASYVGDENFDNEFELRPRNPNPGYPPDKPGFFLE